MSRKDRIQKLKDQQLDGALEEIKVEHSPKMEKLKKLGEEIKAIEKEEQDAEMRKRYQVVIDYVDKHKKELAVKLETLEMDVRNSESIFAFKLHTHENLEKRFVSYLLKEAFDDFKDGIAIDYEKVLNRIGDIELSDEAKEKENRLSFRGLKTSITHLWKRIDNIKHRDLIGLKWSEAGHKIDTDIEMKKHRIVDLPLPEQASEATSKEYVDSLMNALGRSFQTIIGGGGGETVWGEITGNYLDQTDIIAYIDSQIAGENHWDMIGDLLVPHITGKGIDVANSFVRQADNTEFIIQATDGLGYKQTFRNIAGTRLEWLWGIETEEDKYLSLSLSGGENRFDNKERDFKFLSTAVNDILHLKHDTGYIGIGVANPQARLDVLDDIQTDALEMRITAGQTKIYDYNTITAPSDYSLAYMKNSLTASDMLTDPTTGWGGREFTNAEYSLIWADNANGAQNLANGTPLYLGIMCEMFIGESASQISNLKIVINQFNNEYRVFFSHALWNFTNSAWDNIGSGFKINTNTDYTYNEADISDYIDADGRIYILQYTTSATSSLNAFRLLYISLTPTLTSTISTLEDNIYDDDFIIKRTSPRAFQVCQSDGTQIANINTATGATVLKTLNLEKDLVSLGQAYFKNPLIGIGSGFAYSFSSGGTPTLGYIIKSAVGHEDIDTTTYGLYWEYFYSPTTSTIAEHWGAQFHHDPTGTTKYGAGSVIGNVHFTIKTNYYESLTGSVDLEFINVRTKLFSNLGSVTGKRAVNALFIPFEQSVGTLTMADGLFNVLLEDSGTGSLTGTLYQLFIEKTTSGSVANYQFVLGGYDDETGVYFNGITGAHLYSNGADLLLDCGTEQTLELVQPVWDDLRVSASSVKVQGSSGIPSYVKFKDDGSGSTGVWTYDFEPTNLNQVFFTAQMPHTYKEGTDLMPHVHWSPKSTNTGDVDWILEYTIVNIGGTFGNTTTIHMLDTADGVIDKHQISVGDAIDGSGLGISHMIVCRLYRDGGEGDDDFTGDASLLEFDLHFQIDTMGSRRELYKNPA